MSISAAVVSSSNQYHYSLQNILKLVQHSHVLLSITTDTMSLPRQNCIFKCSIKHSSFAHCVNFLKKTQDEKMIFAVKNKICLVCIKPKESSVQLSAKSKCQCDMMTSCLRKTNCWKTCFYCQQNHHYLFCKLHIRVQCGAYKHNSEHKLRIACRIFFFWFRQKFK